MVATRHSLPSAVESSPPPPPPTDRKALLALKRLQVDGTDALRSGHLPPKQATSSPAAGQTYHWRGSVYAVTGNEPEEWLTAQPKRHKQRSSTAAAEEEEPVTETVTERQTRKRRRQDDDEEEEKQEAAPPKRQKRSPPKRRSTGTATTSPPKSRRRKPPQASEDEGRMQRARLYDYTRIAQPSEYTCAEAARRAAHLNGYAINPIPKKVIASQVSRNIKNKVVAIAKINDQMAGVLRTWRNLKYEWICARTPRHLHETNEEILNLKRQIDADEELPMTAVQIASEVTNLPAFASSATPPATTSPPAPLDPSALSPESLSPAAPKTPRDEPLPFAGGPKGLQKLRMRAPVVNEDTPESTRAENAIRTDKLGGESRSARRRRIKRELALVRGWPVEEETAEESVDQTSSS